MTHAGGVLAALITCALWAYSTLRFHRALSHHGPFTCNAFKTTVGAVLFTLTAAAGMLFGLELPSPRAALLLLASGVAGLSFGDFSYFAAIVRVGPRLATLVHSTFPLFLLAFTFLDSDSRLRTLEVAGILLILMGVLDVTRRTSRAGGGVSGGLGAGVAWALLGALGQAVGILLAKDALAECDVVAGAALRMIGASLGIFVFALVRRRAAETLRVILRPATWRVTIEPTIVGTYLGILTMTLALDLGNPAVVGALISLTPVYLVPLTTVMLKEPFDWRVLAGTLVAVAGVILVGLPD